MIADTDSSKEPTWTATSGTVAAQAHAVVPELAKHEWQDTFFDEKETHDIIAVFDHDAKQFALEKRNTKVSFVSIGLTAFGLFYWLSLFLSWLLGLQGEGEDLQNALIAAVFYCTVRAIFECATKLPHTAITAEGLVHVSKYKTNYIFPLSDIVNMTLIDQNFVLTLTKRVDYYKQPREHACCVCWCGGPLEYTMAAPMHSLLLSKAVEALQMEQRFVDAECAKPVAVTVVDKGDW
ncbi:hypothetical protein MPSEU_000185600 [Mayamaea pseudoterrestris]|nr:hypothetical protein MPSEU_000185600 [Mayamaea pseudoterrestris]